MSKFSDFYAKVMEDDALKAEVVKVLGGSTFDNATDDQLTKIGEIAKGAGFDFTIEEAKAHFEEGELDDDDLDAVAGGKDPSQGGCQMGIIDTHPRIDPSIFQDVALKN